jgi:recombination protein RecA
MAKKPAAQRVLDALNKKLPPKDKATMARGGSKSEIRDVIPTGIEVLDWHVLGTGGLVAGRVYEVFSDASAGKSSLGFQFLGAGQRAGGAAVLVTTEDDLLVKRAEVFDVDLDELILREPDTLEETLNLLRDVVSVIPKGVGPNVVVWDSLAATELKGQDKLDFGGKAKFVGTRGKQMSDLMPVLCRLAVKSRTAIVVVNQLRSKIGVFFGNPDTTPGGNALKFHASARLQLWAGAQFPEGALLPQGIHTTIKGVKNKLALPLRKAKLRLDFEKGWLNEWSLLNLGKDLSVLKDADRMSKANLDAVRQAIGAAV